MSKIFVCGATGTQGGVIARQLLAQSVHVNFMTRNPSSPQAQALTSLGATLWPGTYDDPAAIAEAMKGCTAVFMNFMPSFTDLAEETRHATAIVDAAIAEGIKHAVYSSTIGLYEMPKMPGWDPKSLPAMIFDAKLAITNMVKSKFESWATIRPAKFMSDFLAPRVGMLFPGLAETGVWTTALRAHDRVPLVDTKTVGAFGAAALTEPERFNGHEVDVFDQIVTPEELVASLGNAVEREMSIKFLSEEEIEERRKKGDLFITAQLLMRDAETYLDLGKVKGWGIPLNTWDKFLETEKGRVVETYGKTA